jgi:1-acyl-sn-glycerol-3-phosphate acyltransferase
LQAVFASLQEGFDSCGGEQGCPVQGLPSSRTAGDYRSMVVEPHLHPCIAAPKRQDAWYWRLFVTGLSFFLFPLGAAVVGFLMMPLVRILPASRERKRARARKVMSASLRLFVGIMSGLGGMTYEFVGAERLSRPGQLIVANHPSLIDVVFLLAFVREAGCVVKQGLWRNPMTRGAVVLAEFISNEATATMIEGADAALRDSQCLIMFPEGTRTVPGQPFVFHRSAANVALRAATCLTPVYIRVRPTTLTKAEPWYRNTPRRPHFSVMVGDDIDLAPFRDLGPLPVSSRALNDYLQSHFHAALTRLDEIGGRPN